MDEKEFWKATPRKLFSLLDAHNRANSVDEEDKPKQEPQRMTLEELRALQTARK